MAIVNREKLINWEGKDYVDVRSYEAEAHIRRKKPIRVIHKDRYIDLTPQQLKKPVRKSESFKSKYYPDQSYRLYFYEWKNTKPIKKTPEQEREELKKAGVYI